MNWDRVQGQWKQLKGKIKTKWGKLTDDDLDIIAGQKDQLIGKIQERYGLKKAACDAPARVDSGSPANLLDKREPLGGSFRRLGKAGVKKSTLLAAIKPP